MTVLERIKRWRNGAPPAKKISIADIDHAAVRLNGAVEKLTIVTRITMTDILDDTLEALERKHARK